MILTNRWAVLALLCYVRVVMGLQLQAVSALAPLIQADLRIDYADLGVLVGRVAHAKMFVVLGTVLSAVPLKRDRVYVVDLTGSIPIAIWVGGAVWLLMAPAVMLVRDPERARSVNG